MIEKYNPKKKWYKSVALVLALAVSLNLLSGCGQVNKNSSENTVAEAETTETVIAEKAASKTTETENVITENQSKTEAVIENLNAAIMSEDVNTASDAVDELLTLLDETKEEISQWFSSQDDIANLLSDETEKVYNERKTAFEEKFSENEQEAEKLLEGINDALKEENFEGVSVEVAELKSLLIGQKDTYTYGDTLLNEVSTCEAEEEEIDEALNSQEETNNVYEAVSEADEESETNDEYLEISGDLALSDELTELASELSTPLAVYNYLKNNIGYETYYGSRKGASGTLSALAGNDIDQASLLISMLRYLGYQAYYVRSNITITPEQAMSLTGADTAENAAAVLAAAGTPVTKLTLNEEIVKIRMEHVWVRAYVPYTDYRGAGDASGDYIWIDLDTGIKEYEEVENIYAVLKEEGLEDDLDGFVENGGDASQLEELLSNWDEKISSMDLDNLYARKRIISQKEESYLPLSLQFKVEEVSETFTQVKEEDKDSVSFAVNGETLATFTADEFSGKNIVLSFAPASDTDLEIYNSYDSIFDIPAYLVYMIPVIYVDGEIAAKGDEYLEQTIGTVSTFTINLSSGGNKTSVSNEITTGSMYAVTLDLQSITADELQSTYDEASVLADSVTEENVYSVEYMGPLLSLVGKLYFAQVDVSNLIVADSYEVTSIRSLSEGIVGYEVETSVSYGLITGIDEGSFYIDVDTDSHYVTSLIGDSDAEKSYMLTTGIISSLYESAVWEEMTGYESVSTISILAKAEELGIETLFIAEYNISEEIEKLETDDNTKKNITNAVNSGKVVIIPSEDVTLGSWNGTGYIILNPETCAGSYMISGGLNGGSVSEYIDSGFIVSEMYLSYSLVSTMESIVSIVEMMSLGLGGAILGCAYLMYTTKQIVDMCNNLYNLMVAYYDYILDDSYENTQAFLAVMYEIFMKDFFSDLIINSGFSAMQWFYVWRI